MKTKIYHIERACCFIRCTVIESDKTYLLPNIFIGPTEPGKFKPCPPGLDALAISLLADHYRESPAEVNMGQKWRNCLSCKGRKIKCGTCHSEGGWWFISYTRSQYIQFREEVLPNVPTIGLAISTAQIREWWAKTVFAMTDQPGEKVQRRKRD